MAQVEKPYYSFAKGLCTEASLIGFPENFSLDEQNYELKIDGSRRRRKGLTLEDGGTVLSHTAELNDAARTFKWERVAGNPEVNWELIQMGRYIYIATDTATPSTDLSGFAVDLLVQKVSGVADAQVRASPVDITIGRGAAFVVGEFIEPFYIEYDSTTNTINITSISIRERDFEGIDDGISVSATPITVTASHTYNLLNRGWTEEDLTTFRTDQPTEPSKSMIPWLGYARGTTANVAEQDWTKEFSSDKLVAELFQDATAPQGHFIRNPFNTASVTVPGSGSQLAIVSWSISGTTAGAQTVTINTDGAHGLSPSDTVVVSGQYGYYYSTSGSGGGDFPDFYGAYFTFNGTRTAVTTADADTFTISITFPSDFSSWQSQFASLGSVNNSLVPNANGFSTSVRPRAITFAFGRLFYAGIPHANLGSHIFFSQIIESKEQYGKCYQVADPTDERISDILPSDGGVIKIPEATDIIRLLSFGSALLVFSTNGVWQIFGGESGFTATSYGVRKISEQGLISPGGLTLAETAPYFAGRTDIYRIVQDSNSGFLVPQNLTEFTIHSLYNNIEIADKQNTQVVYDDLLKRIIWLVKTVSANSRYQYDQAFIFDTRHQAWVRWKFSYGANNYLTTAYCTRDCLSSSDEHKVKFLAITGTRTTLTFCETSSTDFIDFGEAEQDAYLITGYEILGDASKFKYSPYIWVFSKKTETGYTDSGTDLVPVGESSTTLQARWDWADNTNSGKWGVPQQVYRHRRPYTPSSSADTFDTGQPLVVTRNKVRGRGRALHIKFAAGSGKDSWVVGWHVQYDVLDMVQPERR